MWRRPTRPPGGSPERFVASLAVPVGVWCVAAGAVIATCALAGYSPFRTATWSLKDAALYEDIARHGYSVYRCAGGSPGWCGNAGWFPAYPWLMRLLGDLGLGINPAGLALAWLFTLGTLVLLWGTFLGRRFGAVSAAVLVYAAFAPGQVYDYAILPLSMLAFCTVGYLWLVSREHWFAAGIVGFVLVLVYPVGIATPVAAALYLLVRKRQTALGERVRQAGLVTLPSVASIGLLFLLLQETIGHWNAYFLVQAKYHHQFRDPFAPVYDSIRSLFRSAPFSVGNAPALQTLVVSVVLGCVLVSVVLRRRQADNVDLLLGLWAFATWLIPASTTGLTVQRSQAALLPIALLVGRLPRPLATALIVAAIAVSIPTEVAYLQNLFD